MDKLIKAKALATCAVIDLGKTNIKAFVFDSSGKVLLEKQTESKKVLASGYSVFDHEYAWNWSNDTLVSIGQHINIGHLIICSFGAAYTLVNENSLEFPILDYEIDMPKALKKQYETVRPSFAETFSPSLPGGLNIGAHLFWQYSIDAEKFNNVKWILTLPQFFGWRWSGNPVSEVSYLGCHSDLWSVRDNTLSSFVCNMGWEYKFPTFRKAGQKIGDYKINEDNSLIVSNGVHDSNANLYFYRSLGYEKFTLVSTGTWVIVFNTETSLSVLDEHKDMLANISVEGKPIATARFMGGREFDIICKGGSAVEISIRNIKDIVQKEIFLLPSFAPGGPFSGNVGRWIGKEPKSLKERKACAILYVVCMTTFVINSLQVKNQIIVDGGFAGDRIFTGLLSRLNPGRQMIRNEFSYGTAAGAACIVFDKMGGHNFVDPCKKVKELSEDYISGYYESWISKISA